MLRRLHPIQAKYAALLRRACNHAAQKASDFNDCMLKIIDIIKDQMKRPGQDFKFTLEQPDGGRDLSPSQA